MSPRYSWLPIIALFSFLALGVESYVAINYGIYEGDAVWMILLSLSSLIGFLSLGYVVASYLETRIIPKFELEIPLIAALITIGVQVFFYLWIFSLAISHPIFSGKTLEAYAFSLFGSFAIPFLIAIYLSK